MAQFPNFMVLYFNCGICNSQERKKYFISCFSRTFVTAPDSHSTVFFNIFTFLNSLLTRNFFYSHRLSNLRYLLTTYSYTAAKANTQQSNSSLCHFFSLRSLNSRTQIPAMHNRTGTLVCGHANRLYGCRYICECCIISTQPYTTRHGSLPTKKICYSLGKRHQEFQTVSI